MKRPLLCALSALAGLSAGFGLRAFLRQDPATSPATAGRCGSSTASSLPGAPGSPLGAKAGTGAGDTPLTARLQEEMDRAATLSDDVTRWLLWMTAVEKAGPADYPRLARMAGDMPGALRMLGARWVEMDPRGLYDACARSMAEAPGFPAGELMNLLFETWPQKDPDAVFTALLEQPTLQRGWQMGALNTLFQSNPERALKAMSQLRIDSYGPDMKGVEKWAKENPTGAARTALDYPAGYATTLVLQTVSKAWAESDPKAAMAFATGERTPGAQELAGGVMRAWVERDLQGASDWFAAADPAVKERLLPSFVESWGKKDASGALKWCMENTEGSQQSDVVMSLVKGSLAKDPNATAAMVADMEPSQTRTRAAQSFAESMLNKGWWPSIMDAGEGKKAKPEALEWLGKLDEKARKEVVGNIQWSWSENDPRGFAEWLATPDGQAAGPDAMSSAARSLVKQKPQEAIDWAANIATPAVRESALSDTFGAWSRSQPEAAMEWLKKLPAGDSRRESMYLGAALDALPLSAFAVTATDLTEGKDFVSHSAFTKSAKEFARLLAADPAAARRALNKLPVSEDIRNKAAARLQLP